MINKENLKEAEKIIRNTEIFDFVVFLSLPGSEVFHELSVYGIKNSPLAVFPGFPTKL